MCGVATLKEPTKIGGPALLDPIQVSNDVDLARGVRAIASIKFVSPPARCVEFVRILGRGTIIGAMF